jgi:hypothetical protein
VSSRWLVQPGEERRASTAAAEVTRVKLICSPSLTYL